MTSISEMASFLKWFWGKLKQLLIIQIRCSSDTRLFIGTQKSSCFTRKVSVFPVTVSIQECPLIETFTVIAIKPMSLRLVS